MGEGGRGERATLKKDVDMALGSRQHCGCYWLPT
jgi:hypothetical protein